MNSTTRRTLTPGRIVALSRQGERWWPHNDSPSCSNTFCAAAGPPVTLRLGSIPTFVALPIAAASVASIMSAREEPTYVLQAPVQASVTAPALANSIPTTTLVEPIADRDATARDISIPFAEPAESAELLPLPPIPAFPPPVEEQVASILGTAPPPVETTSEFIDPFQGLELEQELSDDAGPSSGLLPDLDDFIALEDPEILSVEQLDAPVDHRAQSKLAQYQKEFPEIFTRSRSGASKRTSPTAVGAKASVDPRKVLEAVARAEQRRAERGSAANERRRRGVWGKLKQLFNARS